MLPLLPTHIRRTHRGRSRSLTLVDGDMTHLARHVRSGALSTAHGCLAEMKENACRENGMKDALHGCDQRGVTVLRRVLVVR